jgi:hypothetical protein
MEAGIREALPLEWNLAYNIEVKNQATDQLQNYQKEVMQLLTIKGVL